MVNNVFLLVLSELLPHGHKNIFEMSKYFEQMNTITNNKLFYLHCSRQLYTALLSTLKATIVCKHFPKQNHGVSIQLNGASILTCLWLLF